MQTELDFWPVLAEWPFLLRGVALTLFLTAVSTAAGLGLAIGCAWARSSGPGLLRGVTGAYVEIFRNTPFIVQLFFIFFGLPSFGLRLDPVTASLIAMTLNLGAYGTEIIRAGLESTPRGQIEAAQSLAMSRMQVFTRVVLPPALKRVWPALVSQIIIVMLGSAVCGQISTEELSYAANTIHAFNFRTFEAYIVATAIYLGLAIGLRRFLNWVAPALIFGR